MAGLRYTIALCMWLTVTYSTVSGQFFNGSIDNVVIPLDASSVTVSCPIATEVDEIQWFNAMNDTMMVATGPEYVIDSSGSYYCQVTERRGVYRSNTFTVYQTGFADNFSIHPKNFTLYSDTSRVAFECRIDAFVADEMDGSRLRILWEGSDGSNDSFTELSSSSTFSPLTGYSIFVMDNGLDVLPLMVRCRAVFVTEVEENMTVATSEVAYIVNATEGLGSGNIPDNRTILLTPSDEIVTEMDTAAFVCVPANTSIQAMWSDHPNSGTGTNNFYLTVSNVTENATVMCTIDVETINASLVVQEVPVLMANMILPEVTPAREGDSVTLQCAPAITYPPPSIIWLANGSNTQVTTENITIGPVDDSVIYQCLVEAVFTPTTNKVGLPLSTSLITTTLVDCVPNITVVVTGATDDNGDGRYNVMQGNNFIITCMLSCPTTAAVIWRQGDDVISSSDTMMILDDFSITYIPNDNGEIVESVLMKDMAGPSDSGTYQCSVAVQTIQSNDTADIFVYIDPEITQGPVGAARMLGENVTFTCTATGLPIPDITWNDTSGIDISVQAGDDMIINDTARQSQITVSDLQLSDFGMYTCTATNQFASVSDAALLECIPVVMVSVTGATDDDNDGTNDVMAGSSFSITCTLNCSTTATVTWRQNDAIISSSETMTMLDGFMIMYTRNDNGEIVESVLMKDEAEPSDSAMYQCGTTVQTIQSNDKADIFVYIDPEITQGPVDAARMLGNDVTFTCTATGLPIPDITWSNTSGIDIPVQAGDDMIINDTRRSQITVSDLQLGNFGTYTCTATNQFDSVSDSALLECIPVVMLNVTGATADDDDGVYDVMLGDSFTITCTLSCPVTASVTWRQNDIIISSSDTMMMPGGFVIDYQMNDNLEIVGSTLTRNMAELSDSATYQCGTAVQTIQSNDMATIAVHVVPMITQGPVDVASKVGEPVTFTCNATGEPLPDITWSRDSGGVIMEQPGDIMITNITDGMTRQSQLMLTNLKDSDFQNYTCNASNRFGSDIATALLGMEVVITKAPMETTQLLGGSVTFRCIATGIPLPTITWRSSDNREMVDPSNETRLDDITIFSEILLVNISMEDFVNYTCSAMNRFNMVNASAALINATIPMITVPPENAIVLLGGNVTFTCTAIGVPAPTITWSNEVIGAINATSIEIEDTVTTTSMLTLTNLESSYFNQSYTCMASNEHGMVNRSAVLTEGMAPVITEKPQDALQLLGRNVSFRCTAFGIPRPNITWMFMDRNGTLSTLNSTNSEEYGGIISAELNLTSIIAEDFGMYTCIATNMFAGDMEMAELEQGVEVMITTPPQDQAVAAFSPVTFECVATGNRPLILTWFRQDRIELPISASVRRMPVGNTATSTLTIMRVTVNDFTDYFCVAENTVANNTIEVINRNVSADFTLYRAVEPNPPINVRSESVISRMATIMWDDGDMPNPVNPPITEYSVVFNDSVTNSSIIRAVTRSDLIPFTTYIVTITARNAIGNSGMSEPYIFTTMEEAPGAAPQNVVAQSRAVGTIYLSWNPPPSDRHFGIISGYRITYKIDDSSGEPNSLTEPGLNTTLSQLQSNITYTVTIAAINGAGISSVVATITIRTIPKPPATDEIILPTAMPPSGNIGTTSIILSLPSINVSFSHVWVVAVRLSSRNSDVINTDTNLYADRAAFKNYSNAMDDEPYIVAEIDASNYPETFALGDNSLTANISDFSERDYNGPLMEGRFYSYFVRFFSPGIPEVRARRNTMDRQYEVFTTTGFITVLSTAITQIDEDDSNTAVVVGAVIGGLAGLIVITVVVLAVVLFVYRHWDGKVGPPPSRAGSKRFRDEDKPFHSTEDPLELKAFEPNEARHPIAVQEFESHVKTRHKNSDNLFADEYELINIKSPRLSHEATSQAVNIAKNRYANINAYDQTRVRLMPYEGVDGSDYINANYIDGYKKKNAYIATQGPLPNTTEDFWRMVWEQETYTIVMLTNLMEKARVKCHQYWPQVGTVSYGSFTVTLIDSMEVANYCVRTLRLSKSDDEKNDEIREVKQFHYTSWPDFGVPEHPSPIITFMRRIAQSKPKIAGPVVIHCSAGVGRTGTLITIQSMLEMIIDTGTLDIFNFVLGLRRQRSFMVQTEKQYIFIHDTILEAIKVGNTQIEVMNLRKKLNELGALDPETDQSGIEAEFGKLGDLEQVDTSQFSAATAGYNQNKNRFPHILPYDKHRVKLLMYPGIEGSDYINSTFLDGYHQRDQYILTQGPLQNTVGDFWRMIWEYKVSCVTMLCQLQEKGVDHDQSYKYWPELSQVLHFADILIETNAEKTMGGYIMREISITNSKVNESRTINQFQYLDWQEDRCPNSASSVIDMIGWLTKMQYHRGGGPVVIHDCASVGRGATFCALKIAVEQVKTEGIIDVFYTVHTMRTRQPLAVRQIGQYHFIYNAVAEFLDSFDHYANFNDYKAH